MPGPEDNVGSFGKPKDSPIASGERMVGLTAVFEELQNNFQNLLANPAASGYAFYKLGRIIDDNLTKNLRKANSENKEFIDRLNDLQGKDVMALKVGAAIGGIAMKVTALTGELRKAGLEFNRFANLSQLPGGAGGATQAVTAIRMQALQYHAGNIGGFGIPTGGNEAFRQAYSQAYTDLYKQMQYFNVTGASRTNLSASLARYSAGLGLNGADMMQELMQNYSGRGMNLQNSKNIIDAIAYGANAPGSPFGFARTDQIQQMFQQVMPALVSGTVNPVMAGQQTMRLFGALGRRGAGVGGSTLGADEISNLSVATAAIMRDHTSRITLEKLSRGGTIDTGGAAGGVNVLARLQEFLQQQTGGKQITNLSELQKTNTAAYGYISTLGQSLGFNDDQWAVMLNNMPKLTDGINSVSTALEKATKNSTSFGQEAGDGFKKFNDDLQKAIADSQTGLEFLSAEGRKLMLYASKVAQSLGISQPVMDMLTMGLGAAGQMAISALPFYFANKFATGRNISSLSRAVSQLAEGVAPGALAGTAGMTEAGMAAVLSGASSNTAAFGNVTGVEGALSVVGNTDNLSGFSNVLAPTWWGRRRAPLRGGLGRGGFGLNIPTMISAGLLGYNTISLASKISSGQHLGEGGLIQGLQAAGDIAGMFGGPWGAALAVAAQVEPALLTGAAKLIAPGTFDEDTHHRQTVDKWTKGILASSKGRLNADQARAQAEQDYRTTHPGEAGASAGAESQEGIVRVIFSNDQGQQLGTVITAPGVQQMIRIYSNMANTV
jgi:hypothetical protein